MTSDSHARHGVRLPAVLRRLLLLVVLWCVLAEADPWADWPLAAAILIAALATSLRLRPQEHARIRPFAVLRLVPWFLAQSVVGGIDVARRALSPRMPLRPGFIEVRLRLHPGLPRVAFVWIVSLLPGTAGVRLRGATLEVHVLDRELHTSEKLGALEERVRELFSAP
jgi:multicomponent Na+:H+ antiporter subunit E